MVKIVRSAFLIGLSGIFGVFALPVLSQTSSPQPQGATPVVSASPEAKIVKTEVERKGRLGMDTFLGTYLTLSKDCKVGANPRLEIVTPPKNGKVVNRPNAINLRAVPGAPRGNCIGTSPYGLGIFYRADRRFRGEDLTVFRLVYPEGDIREVSAKIVIQ
jgi:hypothetical protein